MLSFRPSNYPTIESAAWLDLQIAMHRVPVRDAVITALVPCHVPCDVRRACAETGAMLRTRLWIPTFGGMTTPSPTSSHPTAPAASLPPRPAACPSPHNAHPSRASLRHRLAAGVAPYPCHPARLSVSKATEQSCRRSVWHWM